MIRGEKRETLIWALGEVTSLAEPRGREWRLCVFSQTSHPAIKPDVALFLLKINNCRVGLTPEEAKARFL